MSMCSQAVNVFWMLQSRSNEIISTSLKWYCPFLQVGTWQHSWLRHYATSQKVMASIPNEVTGFFNWPSPSCTLALRSTQPLTDMSTRNLPGSKGWPACMADNLTTICELTVYKMWQPWHLITLWASTACYSDSFTFTLCSFTELTENQYNDPGMYMANFQLFRFSTKMAKKVRHFVYRSILKSQTPS
jgi:hypothetical protein